MNTLFLTAGKASRLYDLAPDGCKALTVVAGRPIIEWQLDVVGEATIVARSEHADRLVRYGPVVHDDRFGGPAGALQTGLTACDPSQPTTVVFADSFFERLPDGEDWVGWWWGGPWRPWDLIRNDRIEYGMPPPGQQARVCVGVYRFDSTQILRDVVESVCAVDGEVGMAPVLNLYNRHVPITFVEMPDWRDVGDTEAVWRFDLAKEGA